LWAESALSVGERNVTDLQLTLRVGARVTGRIEFVGAAPPPPPQRLQQVSIMLTPAEPRPINRAQPGRPAPNGQFTTAGYTPGRYLIQAGTPGPPWSVRSIMLNGRNVVEEPFELEATDISGAVVTYTDRQTQLALSLQAGRATDFGDVVVIVFPSDYQKWIQDGMIARRARTVSVGKSGQALVAGIMPGDYLAIAVAADTPFDLQSPGSIEMLARQATKVSVAAGETRTQMLTLSQVR
jgi:hypothetical protein